MIGRKFRAPLTDEDWEIWTQIFAPFSLTNPLYDIAVSGDRRDADLMLFLQQIHQRAEKLLRRPITDRAVIHSLLRRTPDALFAFDGELIRLNMTSGARPV